MSEEELQEIERIVAEESTADRPNWGGWRYLSEISLQPRHVRALLAEVRSLQAYKTTMEAAIAAAEREKYDECKWDVFVRTMPEGA